MAVIGDTVKIHMEFTNFSGVPTDPGEIILNIYGHGREQIESIIVDMAHTKISDGVFEQDYVIPYGHRVIYYEVIGNPEGLPSVTRGRIECHWAETDDCGCN
jgi:hypothetical protein